MKSPLRNKVETGSRSNAAVIFLDIDGVLNTLEGCEKPGGRERFSAGAVAALRSILETSDARIVISSSWREDVAHRIAPVFEANGLGAFIERIIDHTPQLPQALEETRRADEIEAWLEGHPEDYLCFLVIDDDPCIQSYFPGSHILTDMDVGLTPGHVPAALAILSKGSARKGH